MNNSPPNRCRSVQITTKTSAAYELMNWLFADPAREASTSPDGLSTGIIYNERFSNYEITRRAVEKRPICRRYSTFVRGSREKCIRDGHSNRRQFRTVFRMQTQRH